MGKKIDFPAEYRGGKLGLGWSEDSIKVPVDKLSELAIGVLSKKLDDIWKIFRAIGEPNAVAIKGKKL